jgi:hypothetical protein
MNALLTYSVALVRKRTIPTELPPLVGKITVMIYSIYYEILSSPVSSSHPLGVSTNCYAM